MQASGGQLAPENKPAGARPSPTPPPAKFEAYQNAAISASLTASSIRPSSSTFLVFFSLSSFSALALLLAFSSRDNEIVGKLKRWNISEVAAYLLAKIIQVALSIAFVGASCALAKVIFLRRIKTTAGFQSSPSSRTKNQTSLTNRQLSLLGIPKKVELSSEPSKKPPKPAPASSEPLVPLHQPLYSSSQKSRIVSDKSSTSGGKKTQTFTPSKSSNSPSSLYLVPQNSSQSIKSSLSGSDQIISTPWSNKRASPAREITTEEDLEQFLADMDKKITESAEKLATPPTIRNGFSVGTPSTMSGSASTSGTRTTPLRPVRLSPASQKFTTPPKKGEGEIPSPMSMEESIEAFEQLGVYPQIEEWRDRLRQWFSSVLLSPLLGKIESSHNKVMQAASKLGISITLSQVGSDSPALETPVFSSPIDRGKEWQPAVAPDEEGLLYQLRAYLVQVIDSSAQRSVLANQQQAAQQNALYPIMQECVDAITEHQRLSALMKGELIKGLLPQSSIPAEYTVQRIRELAEGTCVRNFEYASREDASNKSNKKWTLELPSDSHLLLYLFCAFLEYPKLMLHVDPSSYSGAPSSKNPLFLGVLPPKDRFPDKYVAVVSAVPSVLHPGACVLVVGRQNPPIFSIYWDKKVQFSLQGRTALWDSILLLCHRIKTSYGGFIRGIHLGSSALSLLPILEPEDEE